MFHFRPPPSLPQRDQVIDSKQLNYKDFSQALTESVPFEAAGILVHEQLGAQANWHDTGELAMLFHGTYTTEFYRRLRDALHDEVRGGIADVERWSALARDEWSHRSPEPLITATG